MVTVDTAQDVAHCPRRTTDPAGRPPAAAPFAGRRRRTLMGVGPPAMATVDTSAPAAQDVAHCPRRTTDPAGRPPRRRRRTTLMGVGPARSRMTSMLTRRRTGEQALAAEALAADDALARTVAEAGRGLVGCVFAELWVIAEDGTRLSRPPGGHWMDRVFVQGLPDDAARERALRLDKEAGDCPPGVALAGLLSEESQNKGGVHWRKISSLMSDPFIQRNAGNRMEQCFELGLGIVGAVSFNMNEGRGIVLYFSRTTADVKLLRSATNEQYMACATNLIGATYAVRKARAVSAALKRTLLVASIQKAKDQILKKRQGQWMGRVLATLVMDGRSMAVLRHEKAREEHEDERSVEEAQHRCGGRPVARARRLGERTWRRVNTSRRKWGGAGLRGPPRQASVDCAFVLVGVFLTMLAVLKVAVALREADPRFGFSAEWYSSTLCIMYALTPAPVGQPPQILAAHLWNMLVGLACRQIPSSVGGAPWAHGVPLAWKQALAVALGVSGQARLGIIHPPATGLSLAFASDPRWTWTTLVAVCVADGLVVVMSMLYLNLSQTKQFPLYWVGVDFGARQGPVTARMPADLSTSTGTSGARRVGESLVALAGSLKGRNAVINVPGEEDAV